VPYGTDAPSIAGGGVPTVVFGPGSIAQAHTCDEWLELAQLHEATDLLFEWVMAAREGVNH
jgi:acetylornithine deacetylase